MKLITVLAMLVFVNGAFAISAFEKKTKKEMSDRTATLIEKVESAQVHAKKEEIKEACADLQELLKIYPEHLKAVGSHMDNNKTKVIVARDEILNQLIFVHRQSVVCDRGETGEYVDGKDLSKTLNKISKSLKKQKKLIDKEHTDYANEFSYHYEF